MAEKISKFRFQNFIISSSLIKIEDNFSSDVQLEIDLNQDGSVFTNNIYVCSLDVRVFNETNSLNINVKLKGIFEFDNEIDEESKNNFFNVNAPAILFPYLRAYITSLTALSGITPVILPTINLAARAKKIDSKAEDEVNNNTIEH